MKVKETSNGNVQITLNRKKASHLSAILNLSTDDDPKVEETSWDLWVLLAEHVSAN